MSIVLDASASLAWLFPEEFDDVAERHANAVRTHGGITSPLWHLEVSNTLLVKERRGDLRPADTARAWAFLDDFPMEDAELDPPHGELVALAREHLLSAYDASYLWLAMRSGLPLATRDTALAAAAEAAGVELA